MIEVQKEGCGGGQGGDWEIRYIYGCSVGGMQSKRGHRRREGRGVKLGT